MILRRHITWGLCCAAVALLSIVTFTPIVTPAGEFRPVLFGVPYTLWMGILVTAGFVALTFVATRVFPPDRSEEDRSA